ncbi:voltage-dependent calcium channel subunit alpha-2/delta-3-like [Gigantopelta aegis]|uniref:voltage-dependent calcium channel subunit alpha-2/delta-3-like n=1 Tax=Gigantopelta aegis TaxID=1735272 RepID=UPI001B889B26|nr:voltage-dependent calcium channel subunit alpha-2/delta-3-like [Gigantopelta aegis]
MSTPEVIAKHDKRKQSVAAVVGFQMKFDKFKELFSNITNYCPKDMPGGCEYTCNDTEYMSCYLIDNNGFVMTSNDVEDYGTGDFFGLVDGSLMNELIMQHIYEEIKVTDNQGVCEVLASDGESSASFLMNPLKQIFSWITWSIAKTVLLLSEWNFYSWISNSFHAKAEESDYDGFVEKNIVKFYHRFTVSADPEIGLGPMEDKIMYYEGCDKEVKLYNFNMTTLRKKNTIVDTITGCGNCRSYTPGTYVVRWLQDTNLILVVAATNCSCGYNEEFSLVPEKIIYILLF